MNPIQESVHRSVMELFDLTGRVALVTGGAGKYGRQMVEALAETGAEVFMASRDLAKLEPQAQQFRDAGLNVRALPYDQGCEGSIVELRERIIELAGGIDVLVNNAVLRSMNDWSDPVNQFAQSMTVNATGMFLMTRVFGEHMAERGRGSIVQVGSIHGVIAPDYTLYEGLDWGVAPDYFFHKGGLVQLTRFAASKLGSRGVRVNAILPGGFFADQDPQFVRRYNARTLLGRMANETDLKGIVVFLASAASAYLTGTAIPIDGGYTAK